jgi:hypothetical protein
VLLLAIAAVTQPLNISRNVTFICIAAVKTQGFVAKFARPNIKRHVAPGAILRWFGQAEYDVEIILDISAFGGILDFRQCVDNNTKEAAIPVIVL